MNWPALCIRAWTLGLAPADAVRLWDGDQGEADHILVAPSSEAWEPHKQRSQAQELFQSLREYGWSTSVVWFGDYRQYGEAWAACDGRSYSVRWPLDVPTEAHALVLVSVQVADHLHGIPGNNEV